MLFLHYTLVCWEKNWVISSRVGDAQAKSAEFSSFSCFQRGFPLGATILIAVGKSLLLERNPFWVEGIL